MPKVSPPPLDPVIEDFYEYAFDLNIMACIMEANVSGKSHVYPDTVPIRSFLSKDP